MRGKNEGGLRVGGTPTDSGRVERDSAELREFGYGQQLERSMGRFSSFAIAFSLISILTGIFTNYGHGLRQLGPAIVWSWLVVVCGQFLVALVLAELSTHFPLSGYGYQWTSRLVSPHFGFFVGWLLLLQLIAAYLTICYSLAREMSGMAATKNAPDHLVPWLTVVIVMITTLVHLYGIRVVAKLNDLGVAAEVTGVALLIGILFTWHVLAGTHDPSFLLESPSLSTGGVAGFKRMASSLLLGAWCLTGFEAAADLAEETRDPRRIVPWAIVTSLVSAGVAGFLLLVGFVLAIGDLSAVQASSTPLQDTLRARFGPLATQALMVAVLISIFACGLACMAAASRLLFAMARDNMLPGSHWLKSIHPERQSPTAAVLVVALLSIVAVLGFSKLDPIASMSTMAGYLGYAGIVFGATVGLTVKNVGRGFSLGRWRRPVCLAALCWTLLLVLALALSEMDGTGEALVALAVALSIGTAIYLCVIRRCLLRGEAGVPIELSCRLD